MSETAKRRPDQQHVAVQVCPEIRMLHGNQLDAVTGAGGWLPAVQSVYDSVRITDGTSNTIFFA